MVTACLRDRRPTSRWNRLGNRAVALLDGACLLAGALLVVDAARSAVTPDASLLGLLVRWPGGRPLPMVDGLLLGTALLVRSRWSAFVLVPHLVLALVGSVEFLLLRADGLRAAPIPFTLLTAGLLMGALARLYHEGPLPWRARVAGAALAGPFFLFAHLFSFGATDYARPADAIVVFGAGVYPDGSPSLALYDRMKHGIRLHRAGTAPRLVLSGGDDEVAVMRRMALEGGVPEAALVLDPAGLNTYATVKNLRERRVVAVSHYYHLARIKLAARRQGILCATAPCPMTRRLAKEPWYVAREGAAFVSYYLFRG